MNRLEDRIRTGLQAAADQMPEGAVYTVTVEQRSPRRVRSPLAGIAVTVGVLVVFVGSLLWMSIYGLQGGSVVADSPSPTQPQRFPIPGYVPPDAELVYGDFAVPDPANPDVVDAVIARTSPDGFTDGVVVTVYDASPDEMGTPEGESVAVNGQPATLSLSKGGATLWMQQGERVVSVRSPSGDVSFVEVVAAVVEIADSQSFGEGILSFERLPDGSTLFAPPRLTSRRPHPYVSMESGAVDIKVANVEVLEESLHHVAGSYGSATVVDIAGVEGFVVRSGTATAFMWSRGPDLTVTVSGTFSPGEIYAVAEGLEFVSESEWRRRYNIIGPQPPTTTTTQVAPATALPAVDTDGDEPGAPTTTAP